MSTSVTCPRCNAPAVAGGPCACNAVAPSYSQWRNVAVAAALTIAACAVVLVSLAARLQRGPHEEAAPAEEPAFVASVQPVAEPAPARVAELPADAPAVEEARPEQPRVE